MDFEYQNGTGPIDARSPFAAVSMNSQRFPPGTPGAARKSVFSFGRSKEKNITADGSPKGDYNAFDSPTRPGASRNPSPNKALPPVPMSATIPAYNSLFGTPRKPQQDTVMEDSSAGETPKSPERQDDSEAGTPAERYAIERRKMASGLNSKSAPMIPTAASLSLSPSKERERERDRGERERRERRPSPTGKKESFLGRFKKQFNSPGRGEIPRGDIVQTKEKRIRRQRSREANRQLAIQKRYSMSGSGSEAENDDSELIPQSRIVSPRKRSANYNRQPTPDDRKTTPPPKEKGPHWISNLFTFIGAHPTVPHILTFYAQLAFNLFLLGACTYMIYCFWSAIQGDVDKKAFEASADIMADIKDAADHYRLNGCDSKTRAPALKTPCDRWEKLMGQDPMKIARAKVSAHTFAEIFNSFVEPISYKAMLFTALLIFGCFAISNFAFGVLRNKALEQQQQQAQQQFWAGPPPTPQRTFSGLVEGTGTYQGTPWHGGPALEPRPSRGFDIGDGQSSPRRRLVYT